MKKIKRCPFCGSTVHVQMGIMAPMAMVVCDNDDCAAIVSFDGFEKLNETVEHWQRRTEHGCLN